MNRAPGRAGRFVPASTDNPSVDHPVHPLVSVIIVVTNEIHHVRRCLPTLTRQTYPNYEVVVVDNESTDGTREFIDSQFPTVRVIRSGGNLGYPGANNLGFEHANGEFLAVLNPDTEVHPDWISSLVQALSTDPDAGLATSRILLMSDRSRVNACGNNVSLPGLTFCRGVNEPAWHYEDPCDVTAVSGAAFMVRRSVIDEIGPFDPDFVAYLEETDLSLRALLAGHRSIYVPNSIVWHDYEFRFNARKCFHIEKNRLAMLAKNFSVRTLLLLSPILLATELMVWAYVFTHGLAHVRAKAASYFWLLKNVGTIAEHRTRIQQIRRVSDRDVLAHFVPGLPMQQVTSGRFGNWLERAVSRVFRVVSDVSLRYSG